MKALWILGLFLAGVTITVGVAIVAAAVLWREYP